MNKDAGPIGSVLNFIGYTWTGLMGGAMIGAALLVLAQGFGLLNGASAWAGFGIAAVQLVAVGAFSRWLGSLVGVRGVALTVAGALLLCLNLGATHLVQSGGGGIEVGQKIADSLKHALVTFVPWSIALAGSLYSLVEIGNALARQKTQPK